MPRITDVGHVFESLLSTECRRPCSKSTLVKRAERASSSWRRYSWNTLGAWTKRFPSRDESVLRFSLHFSRRRCLSFLFSIGTRAWFPSVHNSPHSCVFKSLGTIESPAAFKPRRRLMHTWRSVRMKRGDAISGWLGKWLRWD